MDPSPNWLIFFLLLVCIFLEAGKTGLTMLPDSMVKRMASSDSTRERQIAKLLEKPSAFFDGLHLSWLSCFVAAALLIWERIRSFPLNLFSESNTLYAFIVQFGLFATLLLFLNMLCSLLPHHVACRYSQPLAVALSPICHCAAVVFWPFVWLCETLTGFIIRPFGVHTEENLEQVTQEEIRLLVDVGNEKGAIEKSEKDMINNIFEFGDRCASEVMTHRTDMIAIPLDVTLDHIVQIAMTMGYSRIPVYRENIDNIVGILYIKDLLCLIGKRSPFFDVQSYMRKVLFIPENMACVDLFAQLQQKKIQAAIAVDEYGGTAGIVSMEDLLESIVGNIQDEYDDEEEEVFHLGKDCYLIDGIVSIDKVEYLFNTALDGDDSDYDTIGGLLTDKLDGLPAANEHPTVILSDIVFTVVLVEDRRIARIRAERLTLPPESD